MTKKMLNDRRTFSKLFSVSKSENILSPNSPLNIYDKSTPMRGGPVGVEVIKG